MKKDRHGILSPPSFALCGDSELIMEGNFKLIDYSQTRIAVDIHYKGKCAVIKGQDLCVRVAAENVLCFCGVISSLSLADIKEAKGE